MESKKDKRLYVKRFDGQLEAWKSQHVQVIHKPRENEEHRIEQNMYDLTNAKDSHDEQGS